MTDTKKRFTACLLVCILFLALLLPLLPVPAEASGMQITETQIGALRWDAWYGSDDRQYHNVLAGEVEKTLSPARFHFRTPFFGTVEGENKIRIRIYDDTIMRQEMKYAEYVGLDYWAFVWNIDGNGPDKVRKIFKRLSGETTLKLCCILTSQNENDTGTRNEIADMLKSDQWVKVDGGRPLMYYFSMSSDNALKKEINAYKKICAERGLPNPYVVVMGRWDKPQNVGADAVGDYGIGGFDNQSYASLAAKAENTWNRCDQIVPTVTLGWNNETRIQNPVCFGSVASNSYAQYATPAELAQHLKNGLNWLKTHRNQSPANTLMMYAWNEFDEGGWLCPTLAVDNGGAQLYNADGSKKINTERIDALRPVIAAFRSGTSATAAPEKTPSVVNTPAGTTPGRSETQAPGVTPVPGGNQKPVETAAPGEEKPQATLPASPTQTGVPVDGEVKPDSTAENTPSVNTGSTEEDNKKDSFPYLWLWLAGGLLLAILLGGGAAFFIQKRKNAADKETREKARAYFE